MAKVENVVLLYLCALKKKMSFYPYQDSSCPELTTTPTARGTALSTAAASKSLRCQNRWHSDCFKTQLWFKGVGGNIRLWDSLWPHKCNLLLNGRSVLLKNKCGSNGKRSSSWHHCFYKRRKLITEVRIACWCNSKKKIFFEVQICPQKALYSRNTHKSLLVEQLCFQEHGTIHSARLPTTKLKKKKKEKEKLPLCLVGKKGNDSMFWLIPTRTQVLTAKQRELWFPCYYYL